MLHMLHIHIKPINSIYLMLKSSCYSMVSRVTTSYIPNMDPNGMRHSQLLLLGAPELLGHPSKEVSSADLLLGWGQFEYQKWMLGTWLVTMVISYS